MDIDATFLPIAVELVGNVFPTQVTYTVDNGGSYDPATGDVTPDVTVHNIPAGVLKRRREESGGVGEVYEIDVWLHHGVGGLPVLPTTGDRIQYDGVTWKVTTIDPSYSSKAGIASKVTARAS